MCLSTYNYLYFKLVTFLQVKIITHFLVIGNLRFFMNEKSEINSKKFSFIYSRDIKINTVCIPVYAHLIKL